MPDNRPVNRLHSFLARIAGDEEAPELTPRDQMEYYLAKMAERIGNIQPGPGPGPVGPYRIVTASMSRNTVIAAETGVASTNNGWMASDFLPVDDWVIISVYNCECAPNYYSVAFYTSARVYISGESHRPDVPIKIPAGAAYVRISMETSAQRDTDKIEFYANLSPALDWSDSPVGAVSWNNGTINTSGKDAYFFADAAVMNDARALTFGRIGSTYRYIQGAFYDAGGAFISGFHSDSGADLTTNVPSNAASFAMQAYPNNTASNNDPANQLYIVVML